MAGRTDGLIKNFRAGAAIPARRIVKFGASDVEVILATAGTGSLGITVDIPAAAGERVDVAMTNIADVDYGGPVTREDPLTSDATGRAVLAAPAAGANVRIIGFAMASGVAGDIGAARIAPGVMQG